MQKKLKKYFWDGVENLSEEFRLRRILEYASFPDLISYPFADVKKHFDKIDPKRLRTSEKRKKFLMRIAPFVKEAQSWDDLLERLLANAREKESYD